MKKKKQYNWLMVYTMVNRNGYGDCKINSDCKMLSVADIKLIKQYIANQYPNLESEDIIIFSIIPIAPTFI